jgi:hypothetical protein
VILIIHRNPLKSGDLGRIGVNPFNDVHRRAQVVIPSALPIDLPLVRIDIWVVNLSSTVCVLAHGHSHEPSDTAH